MKNDYVLVIGGCSLDKKYYQNNNFSFPKKPNVLIAGGKGANQAISASLAGANVKILTRLSAKKNEKSTTNLILNTLKSNNVDTSYIELDPDVYNDFTSTYYYKNGDNEIKRMTSAIDSFDENLIEKNRELILNAKLIVSQFKAPKQFLKSLVDFCYENKKTLVLTPSRPDYLNIHDKENIDIIEKVSFITANEIQCLRMFNGEKPENVVKKYPNKLIVTLGENGVIYHDGKELIHLPALQLGEIVDTTGAGDTFNGNFVAGLINEFNLEQSIIRAIIASSMKIRHETPQNGIPKKTELEKMIKNIIEKNLYPNIDLKKLFE